MTDEFRPIFEEMRKAVGSIIKANAALVQANEGLTEAAVAITAATQAALSAKGEHEDLRDTVARLEGLVMEQTKEIRALRDRMNGQ